ncbi:MAG TPA: glycolate oxidase subunit GlcE [Sphingomonadaceae bacterium]|nr:glycolate oxidase subunit GlcE [Sphingomonadaceae bacterium]
MASITPTSVAELADAIAGAAADGRALSIRGGGSKAGIGAPSDADILDMRGFAGIVDYDPPELVLTARAGTPLAEIEALLASEGQRLAFDPFDHGPIFGEAAGAATIGGIVAAGVSGSRRISAGAARDHLLGLRAVSGRGEAFVAGAKVVKNVTGYDLPKLMTGSWGRLAALTEVTLKVLPAPRETATWLVRGLGVADAVALMARAMGSQAGIAAAAHVPGEAVTALRLEGFGPSVTARGALLERLLAETCRLELAASVEAEAFWRDLRTLAPLGGNGPLWRVSLPPRSSAAFLETPSLASAHWMMDWAGGLLWLRFDGDAALLRQAAEAAGGHAMLVRGDAALRAAVPALHPRPAGVAALERRVRRAFDPAGLFETGRFGDAD